MAANKIIFYLAIVAIVAAVSQVDSIPQSGLFAANNTNKSHHLIVGTRMPGDRLVLRQNVVKNSSWMKVVIEQRTFNVSRYDRITLVKALDQKTNGNGAYASITNGGPGQSSVTIRLKSLRSHGINFVIELYARP